MIGLIGSSGKSTGAHVHVELHVILPPSMTLPKGKEVKLDPEEIDDLQAAVTADDDRLAPSSARLADEFRQRIVLPEKKSQVNAADLAAAARYRVKRSEVPVTVEADDDD